MIVPEALSDNMSRHLQSTVRITLQLGEVAWGHLATWLHNVCVRDSVAGHMDRSQLLPLSCYLPVTS